MQYKSVSYNILQVYITTDTKSIFNTGAHKYQGSITDQQFPVPGGIKSSPLCTEGYVWTVVSQMHTNIHAGIPKHGQGLDFVEKNSDKLILYLVVIPSVLSWLQLW